MSNGTRIVCSLMAALLAAALIPAGAAAQTAGAPAAKAPAPAQARQSEVAPGTPEDFRYGGMGRRDPFKSLLVLQEKKRDVSMLPPIQQVDVQAFKVLGMIIDPKSGNRAMIQAPDGKTYAIKNGDIIGKNEGEVISIGLDGITVREKFLDFMNRETYVSTVLKASDKR